MAPQQPSRDPFAAEYKKLLLAMLQRREALPAAVM